MSFPVGYLLVIGGLCACAPLFKRVSRVLGRVMSVVGFFVGIIVFVSAADLALSLSLLSSVFTFPQKSQIPGSAPFLNYYLPLMIVLGLLLFSRPIRNIRWASLISLGVGLAAPYFVSILFPGLSQTVLVVIFIITTLAIYTLLRFAEDILGFVGSVLAFPPIAVAIGLVAIYFGIVMATLP